MDQDRRNLIDAIDQYNVAVDRATEAKAVWDLAEQSERDTADQLLERMSGRAVVFKGRRYRMTQEGRLKAALVVQECSDMILLPEGESDES